MDDRAVRALVTGVAGLGILLVLRVVLGVAFDRYVRRAAARRPPDQVARMRTRLAALRRVLLAFIVVIVAWSVLEVFPSTRDLGRTLIASGAVVALFVGVAFSVPLGNLGAGILLALTQPVRLGDRITVADVTGTAEEITLVHTVLRTDDDRLVFIPNSSLISSVIVNRSIQDPRRTVTVRLPIAVTTSIEQARAVVLDAVQAIESPRLLEIEVLLGDVEEKTAWLDVSVYTPADSSIERLASDVRERGLTALAREALLPA